MKGILPESEIKDFPRFYQLTFSYSDFSKTATASTWAVCGN